MCSNKNAAERTIPKRTRSPLIRLFSSEKNCKNSQKCVHVFALLCFAWHWLWLDFAWLCVALLDFACVSFTGSFAFMGSWVHGFMALLCLAWLCLALLGFASVAFTGSFAFMGSWVHGFMGSWLCFAWLGFVWLGLALLGFALFGFALLGLVRLGFAWFGKQVREIKK